MPAIALEPVLVVLAFAFAALALALVANAIIISPLRQGSGAVSGWPVVGNPLAWALSFVADMVQVGVNAVDALHWEAVNQATNAWNYALNTTMWNLAGWYLGWAAWVGNNATAIWGTVLNANVLWYYVWDQLAPAVLRIDSNVNWIFWYLGNQLEPLVNATAAEVRNISAQVGSLILPTIHGIEADLSGLHLWIDRTLVPGIDAHIGAIEGTLAHVEVEVNAKASQAALDAANVRIANLEKMLTFLMALGVIASASAVEIANLRCLMDTPCDPLSLLLDSDIEDRITALEVDHG